MIQPTVLPSGCDDGCDDSVISGEPGPGSSCGCDDSVPAQYNIVQVIDNSSGAGHYTFTQQIPASVWTIAHNLGFRPNIRVVDSSGAEVIGESFDIDANNMTVTFSGAFAGLAYLS